MESCLFEVKYNPFRESTNRRKVMRSLKGGTVLLVGLVRENIQDSEAFATYCPQSPAEP